MIAVREKSVSRLLCIAGVILLMLLFCLMVAPLQAGDIPSRLGGGNISWGNAGIEQENFIKSLRNAGTRMVRSVLYPSGYWKDEPVTVMDDQLKLLHHYEVTPMLLFAHETYWKPYLPDYDSWFQIGAAYAERYRPNSPWLLSQGIEDYGITIFGLSNEPDDKNPEIPPSAYRDMTKGLADGVHSVFPEGKVILHGMRSTGWDNDWLQACAPLLNDGTLAAIDMHKYCNLNQIENNDSWTAQRRFDEEFKEETGVTADVGLTSTEFNSKGSGMTEDEAARTFLLLAWEMLGVVGNNGQPVCLFAFPWNINHTISEDPNYGMNHGIDPWDPTRRGQTLRLMANLSESLDFTVSDRSGLYRLEGEGRTMWVWNNWPDWTDHLGSVTLTDIPADATHLTIWGYDGEWNGARESYPLTGESDITLTLPQDETYMIVANADTKAMLLYEETFEASNSFSNAASVLSPPEPVAAQGRYLAETTLPSSGSVNAIDSIDIEIPEGTTEMTFRCKVGLGADDVGDVRFNYILEFEDGTGAPAGSLSGGSIELSSKHADAMRDYEATIDVSDAISSGAERITGIGYGFTQNSAGADTQIGYVDTIRIAAQKPDDDPTDPQIETGKWYRLKNLQYNKYLDTQPNGVLRVEPNGTSDGATWQFEDADDGYYYIDAKKEGRGYLDTSSNHVVSWKDFSTSDGHKWLPVALDDGTFRFVNKKNGREYLVADSDDSVKWNDGQTGADTQWVLIEVNP